MDSMVKTGKYGATNTKYPKTMVYCVVKYVLNTYTLQEETIFDGKISKSDELLVKSQYTSCIK